MRSRARLFSILTLFVLAACADVIFVTACGSSSDGDNALPDAAATGDDSGNKINGDGSTKKTDASSEGDACATATYGQPCTKDTDCSCSGVCAAKACVPPEACRDALLQWSGPTENTDGTCITDLAGFTIRWWMDDGGTPDDNVLDAGFPCVPGDAMACGDGGSAVQALCAYRLSGLANGTWDFEADAYNDAGVESSPSGVVSKTFTCP
jgi:hypothetical protein